jgi:outer membrane protein OmpA-like peptidoglycan-associated protein
MSEPALKAELKIFGQGGKLLTEAEKSYSGEKPGMLLEIRWDKIEENITLMKLTAYDTNEFFSGMDISPWFVEIPHDEVVFPFDSSELQKTEEPKLDDSLKKIQKIIAEHGSELKIKLYIAGYTDTVGTKSYNYDLSDKRAKAIAAYFKAKGLNVLIFYQGFGEDCLAVKTEDETPEQKNRRAIYILGHQQPPVSPAIPRSNWKSLK